MEQHICTLVIANDCIAIDQETLKKIVTKNQITKGTHTNVQSAGFGLYHVNNYQQKVMLP